MIAAGFYEHFDHVPLDRWHWPNFTPREFRCGIGEDMPRADEGVDSVLIVPDALERLQRARSNWRRPFRITSAFRSAAYNKRIGGAAESLHLFGMAFDIRCVKEDQATLVSILRDAGFTGIGRYPYRGFVHADIGPAREWTESR
ncbi:MAG: DUF882 domain-containing protein [Alphaproteobacteria bacterium]|nr:DUF882 domain-containing protein [Alphaproteobacteria bacterium SS10]